MKGGLVKTLDWKIYLGLLAESGDAGPRGRPRAVRRRRLRHGDRQPLSLRPRRRPIRSASPEDLRQRIDVGGPSMIRAAAKNYLRVASVSAPAQYAGFSPSCGRRGAVPASRRAGASPPQAFGLVSRFDAAVSARFGGLEAAARREQPTGWSEHGGQEAFGRLQDHHRRPLSPADGDRLHRRGRKTDEPSSTTRSSTKSRASPRACVTARIPTRPRRSTSRSAAIWRSAAPSFWSLGRGSSRPRSFSSSASIRERPT